MSKLRVLIFVDYYLPGYKGGGPIASVSRIVQSLRAKHDLRIVTRDRDLGDLESYPGIHPNKWNDFDGVPVYYTAPEINLRRDLEHMVLDVDPDLIYLNSYFSGMSRAILMLGRAGKLGGAKIALAPRGEFSAGALALKRVKKAVYIKLAQALGLADNVVWHVSSVHEGADVRRTISKVSRTIIEAPPVLGGQCDAAHILKGSGTADFAWLSRVSPKKNLIGAIEMLGKLNRPATFTIYGPIEDLQYWEACQAQIQALPESICVHYANGLRPDEVVPALSKHQFFLFPTTGENFGHVIAEALAAGCVPLLSDRTPWKDLDDANCGFVNPLESEDLWLSALSRCVDMSDGEYQKMRRAAQSYIGSFSEAQAETVRDDLFTRAMAA